ncbi:hypothetical protein J3R83DRAFT_3138 [Lanmaoa asiatica]|nr:hypothetical protein J3R83DRAFT_3138 [Lanmaoa asiatica]
MARQRVWFITGTSSGFGRRLVTAVLSRGDRVIATARSIDTIQDLPSSPNLCLLPLDITSRPEVIKAVVDEAAGKWESIDVLVNNAGAGMLGLLEECGIQTMIAQYEVGVFGPLNVTNAVLPYMRRRKSGTVVIVGSRSAWKPEIKGLGPYGSAKAAVQTMGETLAVELAPLNIRVLIVEPGAFRTEGIYRNPFYASNPIPDYEEQRADSLLTYNAVAGKQPGDPAKAMNAVVDVVRGEGVAAGREWPLYLVLGKDAEIDRPPPPHPPRTPSISQPTATLKRSGHLKVCTPCMEKQNARKVASEMAAETSGRGQIATAAMSFDDFLNLVTLNKTRPFDFDTMVSVPPGFFVAGEHLYNRSNRIRDFLAEASDYHWNQKKTKRGGKSTVVTYFCAQLEGEQSKSRTQDSDRKSRSRITRYHCGGWLRITVMDDNEHLLRIRMTHAEAHPSFPASFRRPPHTSEFKLEATPKPVSVPVPVPVPPPPPPPPVFANMQHPPHLMVEPGPSGGHPIPAPPGPPPIHPTIPPPPPPPPNTQEEGEHPSVENVLTAEDIVPQARHSPQPVVFFSPEQLDGLKRKFGDMMTAATGPVPPDLAHALGSVFDHIERTAIDVDVGRFSKRQRI